MKRILRRILTILPAIALQGIWLFVILRFLAPYSAALNLLLTVLSVILVIYITQTRNEGAYKILWLIVILALPVPGAFLYLCFGDRKTSRPLARRLTRARAKMPPPLPSDSDAAEKLKADSLRIYETFSLLCAKGQFRITENDSAVYYSLGEDMWRDMLLVLRGAKRTIYAEYFIVAEGVMWDSLVEILAQKVKEGVDVRFMYDDFGSLSTYSYENVEKLRKCGIKCVAFNPLLFLRGTLNNRDHRKMLIIDGETVFSGGVNLADEYINLKRRFGHWKDIGFRMSGDGVYAFSRMFCEFWNAFSSSPLDAEAYLAEAPKKSGADAPRDGFALTYGDSPIRRDALSCELFIELLSQAEKTAWFYTPYLMLGDTLCDAFVRAAKRGVDVRIFLPGIPDKKTVFRMTRSYYAGLLDAGVKIYEYTPGFLHAKACLIDDRLGTVGTVNLDYRSLYLHFENNTLFYKASLLNDLKKDFLDTAEKCREISPEEMKGNLIKRVFDGFLRIFAPLC